MTNTPENLCFQRAVYILTGIDSYLPEAPTFYKNDGELMDIDAESALRWREWLMEYGYAMNWTTEFPQTACIATVLVLDDEFPWMHSMAMGGSGKVANCDEYFGGMTVRRLFDDEALGKVAVGPFITFEKVAERDPVEVYGTPEHEAWLIEMEQRGEI